MTVVAHPAVPATVVPVGRAARVAGWTLTALVTLFLSSTLRALVRASG